MNLQTFYKSAFFASLADGMITPFLSIFALSLGATNTIIGMLSSIPTLASLFSQVVWAAVTETLRKKSWLIILGGIFWSLLWIPIAFVHDPMQLVVLVTVQSFLSAMTTPAWTSFLIMLIPSYKRGVVNADINTIAAIAAFIGTIISGFLLNRYGFVPFIFFAACFLGLMSRIPFFFSGEPKTPVYNQSITSILKQNFNIFGIKKQKNLLNLMLAMIFLNFAVSIAAPFFSVYVIDKMGGTAMDIAVLSAIGVVSTIVFYKPWGVLIDYLGRKIVMLSCIIPVSFLPFVYAIAPQYAMALRLCIHSQHVLGRIQLGSIRLSFRHHTKRKNLFIRFFLQSTDRIILGDSTFCRRFVGRFRRSADSFHSFHIIEVVQFIFL